ncbi:MAG TPA: sterol desaturase family protein [Dongiaceae bacterium]|jgi:sterol desaturase/sphingolipid hydroxylase (fatty acid hydroxylase superfamily)|nr:sterol desaturase family protein [Dongiaceae bacterium]
MVWGFWKNRTHNLARMSLRELVFAYATYPAVLVYAALALGALVIAFRKPASGTALGLAVLLTILVYPLVWYMLHRFVLHGQFLYRSALTARVWKRIHFDHHQDPHNLVVLFGALYTTLPTIALVTLPIGWALGGGAAAAMAFATGILWTCFYEFCHCVQHLNTAPKTAFFKRIKQWHLAHHFHNEQGNYGITNYFWDRLFGTFYDRPANRPKSATVFNIGYTEEMARRYPWVSMHSSGSRGDGNPRRFRVPS